LVSKAIVAEGGIIDVFTAVGLKRPDISILSDQFLAEVRGLKHKNVAAELLAKLLKDEIKTRSARNVVQGRQFSEMLKNTLNAYYKSGDCHAGSNRRADQARQGHGGGPKTRRGSGAERRRVGVLRRVGDE